MTHTSVGARGTAALVSAMILGLTATAVALVPGTWRDSNGASIALSVRPGARGTAIVNARMLSRSGMRHWTSGSATLRGGRLVMNHRRGNRAAARVPGVVDRGGRRIRWQNGTSWQLVRAARQPLHRPRPPVPPARGAPLRTGTWRDSNGMSLDLQRRPARRGTQLVLVRMLTKSGRRWWTDGAGALRGRQITMGFRRGRRPGARVVGTVDAGGTRIRWNNRSTWTWLRGGAPGPVVRPDHRPTPVVKPRPRPPSPQLPKRGPGPTSGEHTAYANLSANGETAWLSEADTRAGVKWIVDMMNREARGFCWKDSYPRGAGKPLTDCPRHMEKNGALCYPRCKPGYKGVGPVCWQQGCKPGYHNDGALCGRRPHSYHAPSRLAKCPPGYKNTGPAGCHRPWHSFVRKGCRGPCPKGYKKVLCNCDRKPHNTHNMHCPSGYFLNKGLARCYKRCKAGYTQTGESCHRPAHSYARKSYPRGAGKPLTCKPGMQADAGLCYTPCRAGHKGVGPVCWRKCPGSRPVECAAGCARTKGECAEKTVNQVVAPLEMVANIAGLVLTGGTANAAKQAAKAGTKAAVKVAVRLSVKQLAKQAAKRIARKLGKTVRSKLVKRGIKLRKTLTKKGMAKYTAEQLARMVADYLFQRGAESIVAASMANDEPSLTDHLRDLAVLDPTGTAEVVAAYAHGKCGADPKLPRFSSIQR